MLAAACGDDGGSAAADALETQMGYLSDGQYARLYDTLHPAQQELISEDEFVECYHREIDGVDVVGVEVVEEFEEEVDLPGTDLEDQDSVALTVRLTVRQGQQMASDTDTFHEFEVDGDWRFSVKDPEDFGVDCGA